MKQTGVVTELLPGGFAEVFVSRESACGGNCGSCGSCSAQNGNRIVAENFVQAKPGSRVTVESSTEKVMKAALIAYILPVIFLIMGYAVPAYFGKSEGFCILCSFSALVFGAAAIVLLQKNQSSQKSLRYRIVSIVSLEDRN